jgi:hypothetical protein
MHRFFSAAGTTCFYCLSLWLPALCHKWLKLVTTAKKTMLFLIDHVNIIQYKKWQYRKKQSHLNPK